jgi:acetoacetyl-CoA synthetase
LRLHLARKLKRVTELSVSLAAERNYQELRYEGFVGNHVEALVAMLATTSLGGIWSGVRSVL